MPEDIDDVPEYDLVRPGDTPGRLIQVMRISGKGSLPGLLDVIRRQLMAGNGISFATDSFDVVNAICATADRMGAEPQINFAEGWVLTGVTVYPAPEPSQARH
jgi:hypothetical protein